MKADRGNWCRGSHHRDTCTATLAATLVAYDTFNPAGQRLIDSRLLNVVLVLVLTTSILGPVLTEHFAPRMLEAVAAPDRVKAAGTD